MSTTAAAPKSILKKASYPATSSSSSTSKETRDRETALYHANLIQQRKDVEYEILLSTETLIDFPLAQAPYDASNPSTSDAREFKKLLRPFQPSDYDALVVERNINEHCGYALCPNPRLKESGVGKYRLLGMRGKAKDFKVVEKEELEKWCSEACARRALYVRVQLSESPAWDRQTSHTNIDLLDEPKADEGTVLNGLEKLQLSGGEGEASGHTSAALALERGDTGRSAKNGLVDVKLQENHSQRPAQAPSLETAELSGKLESLHLNLEGYIPSFGNTTEDSDEDNMDWKI